MTKGPAVHSLHFSWAAAQGLAREKRAGSQRKGGPSPLGMGTQLVGSLCMPPIAPKPKNFLSLFGGEKAKALRGSTLSQPHSVPEDLRDSQTIISSVSFCVQGAKGPWERSHSDSGRLLLSNWLLAQGLPPSLTWGQALSESCLGPLSSLPLRFSQQALRGKEGRAGEGLREVAAGWAACRPFPEVSGRKRCSGWIFPSGRFPPRASRAHWSLSQRNLKFDPLTG